jgi:hypothetical protein
MAGFHILGGGIVAVVATILLLDWLARRKKRASSG